MRTFLASAAVLGLTAGLLLAAPARADVVDINTAAGVRIDGPMAWSLLGTVIDSAGDFDGDGYDDLILGALSTPATGAAYIVFGGPSMTSGPLGAQRAIEITGPSDRSQFGISVAGVGDVNRDGLDDVLIGANVVSSAYLVLGDRTPADIDTAQPPAGWVKFTGIDSPGRSVAGVGDVNQDGYPDMVIGAPGMFGGKGGAYVVFGEASPTNLTLGVDMTGHGARIEGEKALDYTGTAVAGLGDVNGDHIPDIGIGAWDQGNAGRAFVVYGTPGLHNMALIGMTAAEGFRIQGLPGSQAGTVLAGLDDMNGDGYGDFGVAAPGDGSMAATTTILFGRPTSADVVLPVAAGRGVTLTGTPVDGGNETALAGVGDVDRDGYADAMVGVPTVPLGLSRADLIRGALSLTGGSLTSWPDGFSAPSGTHFGASAAALGDVNGDGGTDIAIGEPYSNRNGTFSGSVYIVFGAPPVKPPPEVTPTPGPAPAPVPARASLRVKARPAGKAIPRTGRVVLVRSVVVGAGQSARIVVKAPKRVRVVKTATKVKVRTRHAPRGKVRVRVTAGGPGVTEVAWRRSWKVR